MIRQHRFASSSLALTLTLGLALAAGACSSRGADDGAVSSDGSLTEAALAPPVCNAPVVSTSGAYALIDYCPTASAPGKLVRRELATNTETTVTTYSADTRLARIGAKGDLFHYATLHAASAAPAGAAGPTWHVTVNDWATLASSRDVQPNAHPASPSTYGVPLDVFVAPDGKIVVLTAALDTLVSQPSSDPGIGTISWTEKAVHTMVASLDGAPFTASVVPQGAAPTTYFWKDLPDNRFDFAADGKSVLFTTSSNGYGYLPAAYPITLGPTPTSAGVAAGNVVAGSWNGASYAEVRSVPVGFSTTPQLAVVTPPTRSGPVLCDHANHAQVVGSSLLFVCYDEPADRETLVTRSIDGSGAARTLATVDVQSGNFDASQQIHKVLVTADGKDLLYFVGHGWYDAPTLGSDNQLAAAPAAVYVGPVDGSAPPHKTIAQLNIIETSPLGEEQLLVHDRPAAGVDHYGVLDVRSGQIVSSITRAEPAWRTDAVASGGIAITKDGSSVFDWQQCKVGPASWETGWQPTITHGGASTTGSCLQGGVVGFVHVPLHDAAIATWTRSGETFTWAGGTYRHSTYAVSYVAP